MARATVALLWLLSVSTGASTALAQAPTLFEVVGSDSDLSTLLQAVNASSQRVINVFITPPTTPVTVFAPTNEAFAALFAASNMTFAEVAATVNVLDTILEYHVVDGLVNLTNITDGTKLPTLLPNNASSTDPVEYDELTAIVNTTGVYTESAANTANITRSITAPGLNAILYVIDTVLAPPEDAIDAAYQLDALAQAAAAASAQFNSTVINSTVINSTVINGTDANGTSVNGTTDNTAAGRRRML